MTNYNSKKIIQLAHTVIILRKDSIVEVNCDPNFLYDKIHIQEVHVELQKISQFMQSKLLVLTTAGPFTNVTQEAIRYVTSGPHKTFVKAEAFIIKSLAQRIIANFYIRVNKPIVSANYFTSVEHAEKWLISAKKNKK